MALSIDYFTLKPKTSFQFVFSDQFIKGKNEEEKENKNLSSFCRYRFLEEQYPFKIDDIWHNICCKEFHKSGRTPAPLRRFHALPRYSCCRKFIMG